MRLLTFLSTTVMATGGLYLGCSEETFATVTDAGPALDGSVAGDAAPEAGADAGVDAGHFCERLSSTAFCADFDEGEPAQFGWTIRYAMPDTADGGTEVLAVDAVESSSGPASLLVRAPRANPDGTAVAWLGRDLAVPASATRIAFDYDVYIEDISKAASVNLSFLVFKDPLRVGDYGVYLTASPTALALEERMPPAADGGAGAYVATAGIRYPLAAKWTHVTMTFNFQAAPTVKVDLDGQPAIVEKPLAAGYMRGLASLLIGMVSARVVTGPLALRFDNVVLRVTP